MSGDAAAIIGLEVHIYLRTRAKLFCGCPSAFLEAPRPNAYVCEVCTGQPGAKPMAPNVAAFDAAVRLARALGADLSPSVRLLRKHYFYPDLASGYQRTSEPVATGGALAGARLRELHVEEDPGAYDAASGLVDYNRSGAPLVELVTEPDLSSPAHARRFLGELRLVLDHLGIGRGDAGIKADCNVSLAGGERVEVKNVNSVRNVERALRHEVERQARERAAGRAVVRETRHFDEDTGATRAMRLKETEADYRLLPDPDLGPVDVRAIASRIPPEEAPLARRARYAHLVGVDEEACSPLIEDRALSEAFDVALSRTDARAAHAYFVRDLRAELDYRRVGFADAKLRPEGVADLIAALHAGRLQPQAATRILREAFEGRDLSALLAAETAAGTGDADIRDAAQRAIEAHPKAVGDHRAGKATAANFLVGQAMRLLRGRADANAVRQAIEEALARQ